MKKATLASILKDRHILLGEKRGGSEIGDGTLNGPAANSTRARRLSGVLCAKLRKR